MQNKHFHISEYGSLQEARLLARSSEKLAQALELAEQSGGTMEEDPAKKLESETEKLATKLESMRVGWIRWAANFFNTGSVLDAKRQKEILARADEYIARDASGLQTNMFMGIYYRAQRKLYLAQRVEIAKRIQADLDAHLLQQEKDSDHFLEGFQELSDMLRDESTPIMLTGDKERANLRASLHRVSSKLNKKGSKLAPVSSDIERHWESARQSEEMLRQQMLRLNIGNPVRFETLFSDNANGEIVHTGSRETELEYMIRTAPALSGDKPLRKVLVRAVRDMRNSGSLGRFYRLSKATEGDINVGSKEQRLAALRKSDRILGRCLSIALPGQPTLDGYVLHRGPDYLTLRDGTDPDTYYIFDTKTAEVAYRESGGKIADTTLSEHSFSLAA